MGSKRHSSSNGLLIERVVIQFLVRDMVLFPITRRFTPPRKTPRKVQQKSHPGFKKSFDLGLCGPLVIMVAHIIYTARHSTIRRSQELTKSCQQFSLVTLLLGLTMQSPWSISANSLSASLKEMFLNAGCTITRFTYSEREVYESRHHTKTRYKFSCRTALNQKPMWEFNFI